LINQITLNGEEGQRNDGREAAAAAIAMN